MILVGLLSLALAIAALAVAVRHAVREEHSRLPKGTRPCNPRKS